MAIVDSGAWCSVVRQKLLNNAMELEKIPQLVETMQSQELYRFGNHEEVQKALKA